MPAPAAALIAAGATIASSGANAYAQGRMNKKTREWNDKQYERTRRDALADYETQNLYNSPAAQMQRFREAGLNPNLIYGQSNEGATVRSSDTPSWNPRAPEFNLDPGPTMSAYFQTKMQEAQLRNMETVNTVQQQEALLKGAQTQATIASIPGTEASTAKTLWDTAQSQSLAPYVLEASKANLAKMSAETQQLLDNNERQAALTSSSLLETIERIGAIRINNLKAQAETANTKAQYEEIQARIKQIEQGIKNAQNDNEIKREQLELMKRGQNPNDPTWLRKSGELLDKYFPTPKEFKRVVDSTYDEWKNKMRSYQKRAWKK